MSTVRPSSRIGQVFITKHGLEYKIIDYKHALNCIIQFTKTNYILKYVTYSQIKSGSIYHPLILEQIDLKISKITNLEKNISFIVSNRDVERVIKHRWYLTTQNYISGSVDGKKIPLHRFIMDCPKDKLVHHKDKNPLNNSRDNLKIVTHSEHLRIHGKDRKPYDRKDYSL